MKKHIFTSITICLSILGYSQYLSPKSQDRAIKKERKELVKQYAKLEKSMKSIHAQKGNAIPPNAYNEQDFQETMNPKTGAPEFYKLLDLKADLDAGKFKPKEPLSLLANIGGNNGSDKSVINQPWTERGPYRVGGRTRAIMFDPNDQSGKRVFAGGVSGGLWRNDDITSSVSEWQPISTFWSNTSISSISYDPNNPMTFYVGTGECETGDAIGSGIWKTTDGGAT